jgi:uncharacterized membrane protein
MTRMLNPTALATVSEDGMQWVLRRNCSVTPGQLGGVFVALAGVSLLVGTFFWFVGATLVLPFTAIELVVVAASFLMYARHAADRESIRLTEGRLVVEQEQAGHTLRCEFARHSVRIEPRQGRDRLVELRGNGQIVRVGRYLPIHLRPTLAAEIRQALHGC